MESDLTSPAIRSMTVGTGKDLGRSHGIFAKRSHLRARAVADG